MRSHAAQSPARDPTATLTPEDHTKDDKPAATALTAHGRHFFVPGHMEAKIEMKITGNHGERTASSADHSPRIN